jgi:MHS family proline/betaine transporter-like MFS transporter
MLWLVEKTGSFIAPAGYYIFGAIIGFLSLLLCQKSSRRIEKYQALAAN